ncbi:MAG: tripartite tricarboxylate transporter substrate binding protein [Alphaproteobacteria bacterium]
MRLNRILATAVGIAGLMLTGVAHADDWPSKPITLIVPFPPGGVADVFPRLVTGKVGERLGQPIIVENRPGGATIIATREVVGAAPDGYKLLTGVTQLAINPPLRGELPYDEKKDLVPVIFLGDALGLVAVHKDHPAKTLQDLIDMGKDTSKTVNIALPGVGSPYHVALEQMNQVAGSKFVNISYRGSGASIKDVIGGHVPVTVDGIVTSAPHVKAGTLRALAILGPQRAPQLPDVPTTAELGFPDIVLKTFIGIMAPAGTPQAVIDRLNKEANAVLSEPSIQAEAVRLGLRIGGGTPEEAAAQLEGSRVYYDRVIKAAGIKPPS